MSPRTQPPAVRPNTAPVNVLRGWARDWAVVAIAGAALVTLLGVMFAALIFAMSERKQLTELTVRTRERLTNMDREIAALSSVVGRLLAEDEAAKPDFAKRLPNLLEDDLNRTLRRENPILTMEAATALTRKARELKIQADPDQIATIGKGFLRMIDDLSLLRPADFLANLSVFEPAMDAAGELLGYRSFLIPSPIGQPQDAATAHRAMLVLPKLHDFRPLDSASAISGSQRTLASEAGTSAARLDILNRPETIVNDDFRTLIVDGYDVKLDGLNLRNVVFSNSRIVYEGNPLLLENVYFSNCTFQITPDGEDLVRTGLGTSGRVDLVKR